MPPTPVAPTWPENWREELAGTDKQYLERLKRFSSPADVAKSYRELETKVSSGQLKPPPAPMPENGTPEQIAAWRAENGLPADANAFLTALALPNGIIPGEADRPLLASFAEAATNAGWSQKQYNEALSWYYGLQDSLLAERQSSDQDYHLESTVALQREWGTEFKQNMTQVTQFFDKFFPKDLATELQSARLADGSIIGNSPAFNRAVLELAKIVNPIQTALPNVPGATIANADARIAEIEQNMRAPQGSEKWQAYWRGDAGQRMQEEYRGLITARETMRSRQTAA